MSAIVFIGAGNSGHAMAADCKLGGAEVRMYEFPEYADGIRELIEHRAIKLWGPERNAKDFKRNGTAVLDMVTTDIAQAMKGAKHVVFTCRANAYEKAAQLAVPYLEDGQVISFMPDNFGSFILRRVMRELGCTKKILVGGWTSMPFGSRITHKAADFNQVYIMYRAVQLRYDTLPSCDAEAYIEAMADYPCLDTIDPLRGDTMLDVNFSNVNPLLHVPATLYNAGAIENWGIIEDVGSREVFFDIYRHGFSPSISNIQWAQYQEECAIAKALGVGIQPYDKDIFYTRSNILGVEFMGDGYALPMDHSIPAEDWMIYMPGERFDLNTRYITEDLPIGCRMYHDLGVIAGVQTPVVDAMLVAASVMKGVDYFTQGFSPEYIGIGGLSPSALLDYLKYGTI